jgi:predicted branched-subunit amino acid permease
VTERALKPRLEHEAGPVGEDRPSTAALFRRGFVGLLPFWIGAIPIGIAYGVAARGLGFSAFETQLMSLIVFSASAQVSTLSLLAVGAPVLAVIMTALALNAQLLLIGMSVGREERPSWLARIVTALFLTEAAYGVALAHGRLRLPILVGAGASMFTGWNIGTAIGVVAGAALPDPRGLGVDLIVPLAFLAVLVPLIRSRAAVVTALAAGLSTLALLSVAPTLAILGAGLIGGTVGAWWSRRRPAIDGPPR